MADKIQPLQSNIAIVDKSGQPTDYFIRYMQQQLGIGFVPSSRIIGTGKGLTGGGDLTKDRTISLDATLGDLNDVDETTNPPTDGQVLTFIATDGKWEPADATGGGGSTGEVAWKVDAVGTGAPQNVVIPDIDPTKQRVMVFVNGLRWQTTEYTIAGNIVTLTTNSVGDSIEIVGPLGKADGTAFVTDAVGTGAPQNVVIPFPLPTTQSIMVFVNGLRWQTTEYTIAGNIVTLTTNSAGDSIEIVGPLGFVTVAGSVWWFNPPTAASMALASGDATNLALTDDAEVGLIAVGGTPVAGDKCRFAYRTLTTPSGDWSLIARLDFTNITADFAYAGLLIRDTISGRCIFFKRDNRGILDNTRYTDLGTFNSGGTSLTLTGSGDSAAWFRIDKAGSTANFYYSTDGKTWIFMVSESITAFLSNPPDQVGFAIGYNRTTGSQLSLSCGNLSLTGSAV